MIVCLFSVPRGSNQSAGRSTVLSPAPGPGVTAEAVGTRDPATVGSRRSNPPLPNPGASSVACTDPLTSERVSQVLEPISQTPLAPGREGPTAGPVHGTWTKEMTESLWAWALKERCFPLPMKLLFNPCFTCSGKYFLPLLAGRSIAQWALRAAWLPEAEASTVAGVAGRRNMEP